MEDRLVDWFIIIEKGRVREELYLMTSDYWDGRTGPLWVAFFFVLFVIFLLF